MIASMNVRIRSGLGLGVALALSTSLAGAASAQTPAPDRLPAGALLIVDGNDQPVGVLVPFDVARSDALAPRAADPMLEMAAWQDAVMWQMQARMAHLTQAAAVADAGTATTGLVIRSVTTGADGCSHTVVWRQGPADSAPRMVLDQVADRCASAGWKPGAQMLSLPQAAPAPAATVSGLQSIVDVHAPAAPAPRRPF